MKEIEDHTNRWRDSMFLYQKNQYCENDYTTQSNLQIQCNFNFYQTTNGIFLELEQKISQFVWKHKRPWIAKSTLKKKNGAGGINLTDFRLSYKATVIKTLAQNRNTDQWNTGTKTDTQTNRTKLKAQR